MIQISLRALGRFEQLGRPGAFRGAGWLEGPVRQMKKNFTKRGQTGHRFAVQLGHNWVRCRIGGLGYHLTGSTG